MVENCITVGERAMEYAKDVRNTIVIGVGSNASHDNCVIIGNYLNSDYEYQIKVGNTEFDKSKKMTEDEFNELHTAIVNMLDATMNYG